MLLAIDVGNTNVTLGLYEGERLAGSWRLQTIHQRTSDEYGLLIEQLIEHEGHPRGAVTGVVGASVVPQLTPMLDHIAQRRFGVRALIVGPGVRTRMPILYDPPKDVGADRIVNAVAAYARFGTACVVVDFGTATTFDSITADGAYAGGAIAPGISISLDALFHRAARLPKVPIERPERVVGRSTVESIQAGTYYGYVGLVDGLVRRMVAEMDAEPVRVLATGGQAAAIAAAAETIELVDEHLTLEGLRLIHAMNAA